MVKVENLEAEKIAGAQAAMGFIRAGMTLALGTGTTTAHAVEALARRPAEAPTVTAVASSRATQELCLRLGLRIRDLEPDDRFDLMIDGADEVSPALELTKGGGGALFREKFLARLSRKVVIVVDHSKLVEHLGSRVPIPVEVVPFARPVIIRQLAERRIDAKPRTTGGQLIRTDNGNEILDLFPFPPVTDAESLDRELHAIPGIVETGIFLRLASRVIVGLPSGEIQELLPKPRRRAR